MPKRQFPLSIRDVSPGPNAVRLTGKTAEGATDGFHTGGAWLYQNKVWKPLDGRPFANAQVHIETYEEDCLKALQGKPLFPRNWEIKEANGRRFVVRDRVPTFPGGGLMLTLNQVYEIERGIQQMNSLKWEVNDDLVIGKDRSGKLFIVDLSAASLTSGNHAFGADDSSYFNKLCNQAGYKEIPALRRVANELAIEVLFNKKSKEKNHNMSNIRYFYSCLDKKAKIKDTVDLTYLVDELSPTDKQLAQKFIWLGSSRPLPETAIRMHKLHLRYYRKST